MSRGQLEELIRSLGKFDKVFVAFLAKLRFLFLHISCAFKCSLRHNVVNASGVFWGTEGREGVRKGSDLCESLVYGFWDSKFAQRNKEISRARVRTGSRQNRPHLMDNMCSKRDVAFYKALTHSPPLLPLDLPLPLTSWPLVNNLLHVSSPKRVERNKDFGCFCLSVCFFGQICVELKLSHVLILTVVTVFTSTAVAVAHTWRS